MRTSAAPVQRAGLPPGRRSDPSRCGIEPVAMRQDGGMAPGALERMLTAGRAAVLSGGHGTEGVPAESGRWGPSAVLLPSGALATSLGHVTDEVVEILGDGHWPSGGPGRAHVTVRALEPYAESVPLDRVARYLSAMTRALEEVGPVRLAFTGVGLSPSGVMACATSVDGVADQLRHRLEVHLGHDGWLEQAAFDSGRDPIWYCTLVHFAGPISDAGTLVSWVDQRSDLALGGETFHSMALCSWSFDGCAMAPRVMESVPSGKIAPRS